MQKELNPDLFGDISTGQARIVQKSSSQPGGAKDWNLAMEMDRKMVDLRGQIQSIADQMNRFGKQVHEAMRGQQKSIEALQQDLKRIELQQDQMAQDSSQNQQKFHNQTHEGRQLEVKMGQMIDRHQTILRNFEVRVNQLQRIIQEKDNQLLSMQSTLVEAKGELARLKRI